MRLTARIKRLEREVHWLKYEGWARSLEMRMKLMEHATALKAHKAAQKAKAAAEKAPRPQPPAAEAPRPEEPREARRLEGPGSEKVLVPTKARSLLRADRDASLRDAPQGEVVGQGETLGTSVEPVEPPFVYDPPEHMQIRPVTWRLRTAEDDWEDDDDDVLGPYQGATEYDPLDDD